MIYRHAGVVRDVPELGITMDNPYANRNTKYTDRIYQLNKPFTSEKPHVLIVGNSFARDFACIVDEYDVNNKFEMSYASNFDDLADNVLKEADYMFVFGAKHKVPETILGQLNDKCKVFGIGTKSYGKNFGIFYANRNEDDYFEQTTKVHPLVDSLNNSWKQEWGADNFIDIMGATRMPNGEIRLFTPDKKVISFDCRHLTQDGCQFYAKRLNLDKIFN